MSKSPGQARLRDDGERGSELVQSHLANVHTVNEDIAGVQLYEPKKTVYEACLAWPHQPHKPESQLHPLEEGRVALPALCRKCVTSGSHLESCRH